MSNKLPDKFIETDIDRVDPLVYLPPWTFSVGDDHTMFMDADFERYMKYEPDNDCTIGVRGSVGHGMFDVYIPNECNYKWLPSKSARGWVVRDIIEVHDAR